MCERLPTTSKFALLIQARIDQMMERISNQRSLIIKCPNRDMEWIDHCNPFEGYDGSDLEDK